MLVLAGAALVVLGCGPALQGHGAGVPTVGIVHATTPATAAVAAAPTAVAPPVVTLAAVGDLMFARDVTMLMADRGVDYPFARVRALLAGADLVVGNLEGTFTDRGTPAAKEYTFRTPPPLADALVAGGFSAVTLANNHSYDFGASGLADTEAALDRVGVGWFGAGDSAAAAAAPLLLHARGATVAMLGFDDIGQTRVATADGPGVAAASDGMAAAITAAGARADYVVVMLHAGYEYQAVPSQRQRSLAHLAIDAGADLVIGAHPHVLQPWERYRGGLILYSLGNFVFDLDTGDLATLGRAPFETAVAVVTLAPDAPPALTVRPAFIDPVEDRPRPATTEEAAAVRTALHALAPLPPVATPAGSGT